jgi:hypothetical protein
LTYEEGAKKASTPEPVIRKVSSGVQKRGGDIVKMAKRNVSASNVEGADDVSRFVGGIIATCQTLLTHLLSGQEGYVGGRPSSTTFPFTS